MAVFNPCPEYFATISPMEPLNIIFDFGSSFFSGSTFQESSGTKIKDLSRAPTNPPP
jgi:hypothetical protein